MTTKKFLTGLGAAATAVKMADVDVITSFPIRPYTGVMMILSQMVANGELDAEFIHADGEHAQLSIAYGASAAGARAFTGSSGVGVTYAFETYSPASGGRYPIQMLIADRTLDPPGDFGSEHTDALGCRDQGWIMGWAETPQEVFDNTLIYYRIGEDPRVRLPQFNCHDGYFVSHIPGEVEVPEQSQVDEFLPAYQAVHPLDPQYPMGHGPQIFPDQGPALEAMRFNAMMGSVPVIEEAIEDFGRIFGRKYSPFVEEWCSRPHSEICCSALAGSGYKGRSCENPLHPPMAHRSCDAESLQIQGCGSGGNKQLFRYFPRWRYPRPGSGGFPL
jgi:oxalate oxidoreductase subunit alpha